LYKNQSGFRIFCLNKKKSFSKKKNSREIYVATTFSIWGEKLDKNGDKVSVMQNFKKAFETTDSDMLLKQLGK
jgi:hypothetical protein